mgnify:CR=1 FL=1
MKNSVIVEPNQHLVALQLLHQFILAGNNRKKYQGTPLERMVLRLLGECHD